MKKLLFVLLCLIFFGCGIKKENEFTPAPKGIIPHEQMVNVLVDIFLAEGAILQKQRERQPAKYYTNYYYYGIFDKYKITKKEFDESLLYYSRNMDEIGDIYSEVLDVLNRKQSEVKNE